MNEYKEEKRKVHRPGGRRRLQRRELERKEQQVLVNVRVCVY